MATSLTIPRKARIFPHSVLSTWGPHLPRRLVVRQLIVPLVLSLNISLTIPIALLYAEDAAPVATDWHYGAFLDVSYAVNFNFPENHRFRHRSTTPRQNEFAPDMALAYVRKDASASSPWGLEFGLQGGYDSKDFAFLPGEPKVDGADTLRHLSRANVSYLAPVGKGLTVTAGLFNSFIGYESLYARENVNYSRSWIADNTPYMMFGVNARYPLTDTVTAAAFLINSYFHLSHPNNQPSYGGHVAWQSSPRIKFTETLYAGPDQADTSLQFWRLYSDSNVEWKGDDLTVAVTYNIGTEGIAGRSGDPRAFVMASALFTQWRFAEPWAVAVRPEFYWDRNGRWTGSEQSVKAITTTLEYKAALGPTSALFRLEHRFDESTGADGGFFKRGDRAPGLPSLTGAQHLLFLSMIWSFDSR